MVIIKILINAKYVKFLAKHVINKQVIVLIAILQDTFLITSVFVIKAI